MTPLHSADMTLLHDLIAALPLPTLSINRAERIVGLNAAAMTLFGKNLVGQHFTMILRQPSLVAAVELGLTDHKPRNVTFRTFESGTDTIYDVHVKMIASAELMLLSFQDVTEIAVAEQLRSEFVANVSHELRSPLAAIMGFIETLRGPARSDEAARDRFLKIMTGEAERMNRLVGDLLSLSRVEADQHIRPTAQLDLRGIANSTLRNLAPLASENSVTLSSDFGDLPLGIIGDADQMTQVFTNLVENAIKYGGADKSVELSAHFHAHDPETRGPAVRITVTDHGPGIAAIHLPRLTERFYRADSHRSRETGGTGLGLAIVKHIVNRHRGRLRISSEVGVGSSFSVVLPTE